MPKQLAFDAEARRKLKNGVDILAEAVKTTLGPKGRNVAIDKKYGAPTVSHDGVTVAKEIELPDPFENMGAQLLKEAATKTNDAQRWLQAEAYTDDHRGHGHPALGAPDFPRVSPGPCRVAVSDRGFKE